ncbi:MAG: multiheme c-type cytochrome, partial [Promethearchaeota archaeon]
MLNRIFIFTVILIVSFGMVLFAGDKPKYIGANKCKTCHKAEKNGAQFGKWSEGKHSKAYEALKSDNAKKKAEVAGVKDP